MISMRAPSSLERLLHGQGGIGDLEQRIGSNEKLRTGRNWPYYSIWIHIPSEKVIGDYLYRLRLGGSKPSF